MFTFNYAVLKGVWIKGLTDDETMTHLESIDAVMQDSKNGQCDCGECDDGDVDPEETPSSYFQHGPVDLKMYG